MQHFLDEKSFLEKMSNQRTIKENNIDLLIKMERCALFTFIVTKFRQKAKIVNEKIRQGN